jgi:23S rRNA (cytosine1962-C5)-methyltransferase
MHTVRVTRKGAEALSSGHLWVYASDVSDPGGAAAGDEVRVVDPRGRLLGVAHYSSTSQIALRLLARQVRPFDRRLLAERLAAAAALRRKLVRNSEAYRLVYSEADQLPGLVIDRYGDCFAIQTLNQGMERAQSLIVDLLVRDFGARAVVARNDSAVRERESLPREIKLLYGELPDSLVVSMNGLFWHVDLLCGQKTGLYLDQRENYVAAACYAHGRALDCFSGTGGFALHLAGVCQRVEAADSSAAALAIARKNAGANGVTNVEFRQANVFDLLSGYAASGRQFDTVVLDPPAFAKTRRARDGALQGYRQLNYHALRMLTTGGILITCSCSHHISEAALLETVAGAALDAGRNLRVLERRTQALDHPILLTLPETHYLKCLILQVM